MIDSDAIAELHVEVMSRLNQRLKDVSDGKVGFERGARARFLLQPEVFSVAREAVDALYHFDVQDLPVYAALRPDFLRERIEVGELEVSLSGAIKDHLARHAVAEAREVLVFGPVAPADILADIEQTIGEYMGRISQAFPGVLAQAIDACSSDPSVETFAKVKTEAEYQAGRMRALVIQLDISDPPTARVAAQAWRRLVEVTDQLDLVLKTDVEVEIPRPGMSI